jgi:hypothetical protein
MCSGPVHSKYIQTYQTVMAKSNRGPRCAVVAHVGVDETAYENEVPHPQLFCAFGLMKAKPLCISVSVQSSVMPCR